MFREETLAFSGDLLVNFRAHLSGTTGVVLTNSVHNGRLFHLLKGKKAFSFPGIKKSRKRGLKKILLPKNHIVEPSFSIPLCSLRRLLKELSFNVVAEAL